MIIYILRKKIKNEMEIKFLTTFLKNLPIFKDHPEIF